MKKILITANSFASCDTAPLQRLIDAGFEVTRNPYGRLLSEEELICLGRDKDAIILSTDPFTKKVVEGCPKLKVVSRYGVGTDNVDRSALEAAGIPLEITRGANADAVADHTVGLMLDVAHHISYEAGEYKNGCFKKLRGSDLFGSNVGIIGLGAIGKGVARRVAGFNCKVYAYDVCYDEEFVARNGIIKAELDLIFEECDFISLHMPAVREHSGFVNSGKLKRMKKTAILINTARSELVNKEDLLFALEKNMIGGYGADVSFHEPNTDDEFRNYPNVVITPHGGAVTSGAVDRMSSMAVENVLKYFR